MLAYDDVDHDTHLNLNEFYAAFSKLYSKPLFFFSLLFSFSFYCYPDAPVLYFSLYLLTKDRAICTRKY